MGEKYYVIDDITGTPALAVITRIELTENRVHLQSVSCPETKYTRTMEEIYATYELAANSMTAPSYILPAFEIAYENDYTGEYVDF